MIYSFGVSCGPARAVAIELYRDALVSLSRMAKVVRPLITKYRKVLKNQ